ncbi:enterochelin esterase [Streptomyces sp. NBC_01352]|uniref:enterochelin esterase n=1 Tax=unclassified Streptomyces TaxID=2593676 RepID=UPI002E35E78F|nr:enterochelin esterase [Streptomyces sp. NBC_01352]
MRADLGPGRGSPDHRPVRVMGPRVARLAERLSAVGDTTRRAALTDAFWREVERLGTPLVEELPGEPAHRAVTFLWRGDGGTRRVLLLANRLIDREHLTDALLQRVPDTDVWHLGLRLRADHRGSYRIAAETATPSTDPADLQRRLRDLSGRATRDPLNPQYMPTRWESSDSSVYALPEAPAWPSKDRDGARRAGRVERHRVPTKALGGERDVWIYLPPGHDDGDPAPAPLPVLVLCDGDMWLARLDLARTLDAVIADGLLPPLAVLSPDAVDRRTRWLELGGREEFVTFLSDELLPWATARRPLTTDPRRTVVAGQSLGGVTALHAAHLRPDRFGKVLAQSSSLWWRPGLPPGVPKADPTDPPWLLTRYATAPRRTVTVHLDVGLHEGAMVDHTRALYDTLRRTGHQVTYNEYNGGHDYACWHVALADGLVRLLGDGLG